MKKNLHLHRFQTVFCTALFTLLIPFSGQAEEVEATFMNIHTASGQTESVMLTSVNSFYGPRILKTEKRITFNGQSIDVDDVAYITFEKRLVDGIDETPVLDSRASQKSDQTVYDMSGRPVGKGNVSNLPKGLYIMNGKKFVIK
ncbi:MAG: hypothetical protein IJS97_04425 [Prevotella sp.]|nr:hypothetical protein [Prevotella sp.]